MLDNNRLFKFDRFTYKGGTFKMYMYSWKSNVISSGVTTYIGNIILCYIPILPM